MRLPLEMRIAGSSDVHLAPQNGNTHGTCFMEVLTPGDVDRKEWNGFMQEVTVAWMNLKDDDGQSIHPFDSDKGTIVFLRTHGAKEWESLNVNGQSIKCYHCDTACKDQIKNVVCDKVWKLHPRRGRGNVFNFNGICS